MTDDLQELLSAYLDGELTSDEQSRVEQQLAEDAEYRQLYDEMRALRNSLELLPRHRLHDDISRSVIRKAERTMLSGQRNGNGSHTASAPATIKTEEAPVKVERQQRFTTRSAVLYTAVALAACLLVMFFANSSREPDPVTKVPENKPPEAGVGPNAVAANSDNKSPEAANRVENGTNPGNPAVENGPAAVPDPRMVAGVPGHQRGTNPANKQPLVNNVPGVENPNLVTVDPDEGKTPLERALRFYDDVNKPLGGAMMSLRCLATQEALDSGAIDILLARHNLTLTAAGEKPAPGEKSVDLPKVSPDLDLIYIEAPLQEVMAILAEIDAAKHHFPQYKYGMSTDVTKGAQQAVMIPGLTPGQLEEAIGNPVQGTPKVGSPNEKPPQTAGENKPADPKDAEVVLEPWSARAHRLRLGTAREKEKVAVIARKQAAPKEPVVRVMILLRAGGTLEDKK